MLQLSFLLSNIKNIGYQKLSGKFVSEKKSGKVMYGKKSGKVGGNPTDSYLCSLHAVR